jgi:hypothetical protein
MGLQKYKCHKIVEATKIDRIVVDRSIGLAFFYLNPGSNEFITTDIKVVDNHNPDCGRMEDGYLVVYEDGYKSWSPAGVFEAGYTLIDDESTGKKACSPGCCRR